MSDSIDDIVIANKALIKIAEAPITSLDDAQSKSSRIMKALMPQAKHFVFRMHPWNCLRERDIVFKSGDKPKFGFEYKYALPSDCLRPLAIQNDRGTFVPFYEASYGGTLDNRKQFVIEGKYILTDTAPHTDNNTGQTGLNFVYTKLPNNLNVLDSNVVELLSYYLAIEAAYSFTGSVNLKQQLIAENKECLKISRALNAQEIAPGISIGAVLGAHW